MVGSLEGEAGGAFELHMGGCGTCAALNASLRRGGAMQTTKCNHVDERWRQAGRRFHVTGGMVRSADTYAGGRRDGCMERGDEQHAFTLVFKTSFSSTFS